MITKDYHIEDNQELLSIIFAVAIDTNCPMFYNEQLGYYIIETEELHCLIKDNLFMDVYKEKVRLWNLLEGNDLDVDILSQVVKEAHNQRAKLIIAMGVNLITSTEPFAFPAQEEF